MTSKRAILSSAGSPKILRRSILYSFPLLLILGFAFLVFYNRNIKGQVGALSLKEQNKVKLQNLQISSSIPPIVSDLRTLVNSYEMQQLLESNGGAVSEFLTNNLWNYCAYRNYCNKIRIIDATGMEILNINTKEGTKYIVPEDKLQFKLNRYYFRDIMMLNHGQVYMSHFDLDKEWGEIERPLRPVIRFGLPLFDSRGKRKGALILTYNGKQLLENFRANSIISIGQSMLLNKKGYWLFNSKPENEWGFMFEDKKNLNFATSYSEAWKKIKRSEKGQLFTDNGLFTFQTIHLPFDWLQSTIKKHKVFSNTDRSKKFKTYFWKNVSLVEPNVFRMMKNRLLKQFFLIYGALSCVIFVFSWKIAHIMEQRERAKKSLLENEKKYRKIHLKSFNGIIVVDSNSIIT